MATGLPNLRAMPLNGLIGAAPVTSSVIAPVESSYEVP